MDNASASESMQLMCDSRELINVQLFCNWGETIYRSSNDEGIVVEDLSVAVSLRCVVLIILCGGGIHIARG